MSLNINIEFDKNKDIWLIMLGGEIDIYTSPELKRELMKILREKKTSLLIDFKDLKYIDSTGLGTLISILKIVKESNGNVYIENIKPNIRKLFDITDLDKVFVIKE